MNILWTRRQFVKTTVGTGLGFSAANLVLAEGKAVSDSPTAERTIELRNTHTGEALQLVYRRGPDYDAAAIAQLRNLMRDHRNGQAHDIDLGLYDQLHDLALAANCDPRFEIISGYRSPESNAKLAAASRGVAKRSLHMEGRAIDVRSTGIATKDLRAAALALARGGVGYYPSSNFVHIDTGAFRAW